MEILPLVSLGARLHSWSLQFAFSTLRIDFQCCLLVEMCREMELELLSILKRGADAGSLKLCQ